MTILVRIFLALLVTAFLVSMPDWKGLSITRITPPISVSEYKGYKEDRMGLTNASFMFDGVKRSYVVMPPSQFPAMPMPLLVVLHGSGRPAASLVDMWRKLALQEGILVVGPEALNAANWSYGGDSPDFLRQLIHEVSAKYPVDASRIYLFGHSAGAIHALYLACRDSAPFAAIAVHAGALPYGEYVMAPLAALAEKKPILILSGTEDEAVPYNKARTAAQMFADNGFAVKFYELTGHNHWYYTLAGFINRQAWEFLRVYQLANIKEKP